LSEAEAPTALEASKIIDYPPKDAPKLFRKTDFLVPGVQDSNESSFKSSYLNLGTLELKNP
jgi:hypothetical protein